MDISLVSTFRVSFVLCTLRSRDRREEGCGEDLTVGKGGGGEFLHGR